MKCPKCGFVSYAGQEQCKKCGYPFVKSLTRKSSSPLTTLFPEGVRPAPSSRSDRGPGPDEFALELSGEQPPESGRTSSEQASSREDLITENMESNPESSKSSTANWREELSERVVNFRRRRAHLQADSEPEGNLDLEFGQSAKAHGSQPEFGDLDEPERQDSDSGMEIGEPVLTLDTDGPSQAISAEEDEQRAMDLDVPPFRTSAGGSPNSGPMEITVGTLETGPEEEDQDGAILLAPLSRRFLAGLTDAAVLLLGASIFGGTFWGVMDSFTQMRRLSPDPLNFAVLGFVAVIYIFGYFGLFCASAAATPGMLWMGCEIRNLRGEHPTLRESLWRAFGILVSISALMLGFIWAYVDSDTLTWHDRMSGTVIAEAASANEVSPLPAESEPSSF